LCYVNTQENELESTDADTSTDMNVRDYRDLCRQIYSQMLTADMFEVFTELYASDRKKTYG